MTTYTRKPTIAQAWQYTKQAKPEWPQWVRDYEVATTMGLQPIGAGPGVLLIPQKSGPTIQVTSGEWLVLEGAVAATDDKAAIPGRVRVYKDEEFNEQFEAPVRGSDHNNITVVKEGQGELREAAEAEVAAANPPVVAAEDLVVPVPGTPAGDAVVAGAPETAAVPGAKPLGAGIGEGAAPVAGAPETAAVPGAKPLGSGIVEGAAPVAAQVEKPGKAGGVTADTTPVEKPGKADGKK